MALAVLTGRHRFGPVSGRVPTLVGRKILLRLLAQFWLGARSSPDAIGEGFKQFSNNKHNATGGGHLRLGAPFRDQEAWHFGERRCKGALQGPVHGLSGL